MEITKSESIKGIGTALMTFHAEMGKIVKSETNPFFNSKYADLSTILSQIKEPLKKAGLIFTQLPVGLHGLSTILMHPESGEWIEAAYEMTPAKNDPQGQGSVITYQRRYALGAVLGLNIDEDDDGNSGSQPPKEPGQSISTSRPSVQTNRTSARRMPPITKPQELIEFRLASDDTSISQLKDLLTSIESAKALTDDEKSKYGKRVKEKIDTLEAIETNIDTTNA